MSTCTRCGRASWKFGAGAPSSHVLLSDCVKDLARDWKIAVYDVNVLLTTDGCSAGEKLHALRRILDRATPL